MLNGPKNCVVADHSYHMYICLPEDVFRLLLVKNAQNNWEKISDVELLYLNLVLFHLNQSFYKNGYVC